MVRSPPVSANTRRTQILAAALLRSVRVLCHLRPIPFIADNENVEVENSYRLRAEVVPFKAAIPSTLSAANFRSNDERFDDSVDATAPPSPVD